MPPRTRRTLAQQPAEENEEGEARSMNTSLRSFFPLEIVNLILKELDLPSLASLCLVSFGCLQEDAKELYRDAVVKSVEGMISFFCGTKLQARSRLIPYLDLAQARTITIHLDFFSERMTPFLIEKSSVSFPPRLRSPIPLSLLTLLPSSLNHEISFSALDTLHVFILPHLTPLKMEVSLGARPNGPDLLNLHWARTLKAWNRSLRSMALRGTVDRIAAFSESDRGRFILRDSPYVSSGRAFELSVEVEPYWEDDWVVVGDLRALGMFEMVGLKTTMRVRDEREQEWKEWKREIEKLSEKERGRVELVFVDDENGEV